MDHVGDRSHEVHGVEHHDGLRRVGHADGHAVILAHADCHERTGAGADLFRRCFVGRLAAHEIPGDIIRIFLRHFEHGFGHGLVGILQRRGDGIIEAQPGRFHGAGLVLRVGARGRRIEIAHN